MRIKGPGSSLDARDSGDSIKCHLKSCNGGWESKVRVWSPDARDSGRSTISLRGRFLKGFQRRKSAAYLVAKHAQFGDQNKIWLEDKQQCLIFLSLMYWCLNESIHYWVWLRKKKKKRISSVLILSMEIPLASQWTMYVSHRFSSYNEVLLKRRLVVIIQLESKSTFFFLA